MSSSPDQDFIGLHIRAVGTWTDKLYKFVDEINKTLKKEVELAEKALHLGINTDNFMALTSEEFMNDDQAKGKEEDTFFSLESNTRNNDGDFCKRIEVWHQ